MERQVCEAACQGWTHAAVTASPWGLPYLLAGSRAVPFRGARREGQREPAHWELLTLQEMVTKSLSGKTK